MVDRNEQILREAADRGDSMLVDDFVRLVEQYHPHERPGIARETLDAYANGLADERDGFDADGFLDAVGDRLTDGDDYVTDAFYRLDGDRVSAYPSAWHDALGGETDLREYVRFLTDSTGDGAELGGTGPGVPEQELLSVVSIVGRTDPNAAKSALEDLRDEGDLVEGADQHPNAHVRLADT